MMSTWAANAFEHQALNSLFPLSSLLVLDFFDELVFDFFDNVLLLAIFVAPLLLRFALVVVALMFAAALPLGLATVAWVCILETVRHLLSVLPAGVVPELALDFSELNGFIGSSQKPLALVELPLINDGGLVATASAHILAFDHCNGSVALFQRDVNLSVSFFWLCWFFANKLDK